MEEIDDMNPRYVDYMTENILAPHVMLRTGDSFLRDIERYLEEINEWADKNCEADWHADFYCEGCLVNGAKTRLTHDCIIVFFELKSDLVAFKVVWGDALLLV